ncbi:hypothetical protein [Thalassobacillus pellis]|uniref:hypothetical protein n=1 Tax=Thalassobacillus pellis TaxID=748008 RepID=UPI001961FA03|nr:hypothetical protein [Thalassobacillus pellis]MBM7554434.1 ribosomal protein L22 [Thalassobacillus pellis]
MCRLALLLCFSVFLASCSTSLKAEEVNQLIEKEKYEEAISKIEEYELLKSDVKETEYDYQLLVQVHKVNELIKKEKFEEALSIIEDEQLTKRKSVNNQYHYEDVNKLVNMQKLVDMGADFKIISEYKINPIIDKKLQQKADRLLVSFLEKASKDENLLEVAYSDFSELDDSTKQRITKEIDFEKLYENYENEKIEKYITLLENKQYSQLESITAGSGDKSITNLNRLANAYIVSEKILVGNSYVYSRKDVEKYLDEINNPNSEIKKHMRILANRLDLDIFNNNIEKKTGVSIGMTKEEVLSSSWGEPEDKNITQTKYGTREQWVYPGFQYLYFEDGILAAIQK